jgi:isopenicillin-N N-acyltransferase like protein
MTMTSQTPDRYPLVEVSGSPYELGRSHGRQVGDLAGRFVAMMLQGKEIKEVKAGADRFVPLFERHTPRLVEEIRGVADGAEVPLWQAYLLQIRGEVGAVHAAEGCTTFAVSGAGTDSGEILIGQNSDMGAQQEQVGIVLHVTPDHGPRILMWTFAGHLGYHGLSSSGVAHFANALPGGPAWRLGLPHYPVKRLMLEQESLSGVLGVLDTTPVCSNGNYMLTASGEILDLELTPQGYARLDPDEPGFLVHTNHYLSDRFHTPETDAAAQADSFQRQLRMTELITARYGRITVDDMKQFLSDHAAGPRSICRHDTDSRTVASLIAEPATGRLHVSTGNPCQGRWSVYEV